MMPLKLKENSPLVTIPTIAIPPLMPQTATPTEKNQEPLFTLIQTPSDKFLATLYSRDIIDRRGRLKFDFSNISLPESEHHIELISNWLDRYLLIEMGNKEEFDLHLFRLCQELNILDLKGNLKEGFPTEHSPPIIYGKKSFPYQQVVQILKERQIVDNKGNLRISLPEILPLKQRLKIKHDLLVSKLFNKKNLKISLGEDFYCSVYIHVGNLLKFLSCYSPSNITSIKIIGGRARKHFLESREFCTKAFQILFKALNQNDIENFITEELFQNKKELSQQVADDDIRIEMPNATKDDLYISTNNVADFISECVFGSESHQYLNWIKDNGFKKFKVFLSGINNFSIATFCDNQPTEIIFAQELIRFQLFTDEITENITPFINPNIVTHTPLFHSDFQNGWQALICNLGNIFHIDNPKQVNDYAFPMVLSRLCHGKLLGNLDGLNILIRDALNLNLYTNSKIPQHFASKGIAGRIAYQFIICLKSHHPFNLESTSIAYTLSACSFLEEYLSEEEIETIFTLVFNYLDLKNFPNHPLLQHIFDALILNKIPFRILASLFQIGGMLRLSFPLKMSSNNLRVFIREIEEMLMMQIHIQYEDLALSLWSTCNFHRSIESFTTYVNEPSISLPNIKILYTILMIIIGDSLSNDECEPIFVNYKKIRNFETENLEIAAQRLLKNPHDFCKYLGYHLLISYGDFETTESFIKPILSNFIEAFIFQTNPRLRELLFTQLKCVLAKKYSASINGENGALQKFFNTTTYVCSSQWILNWIEALGESHEKLFCEVSYELWCDYHGRCLDSNVAKTVAKLFSIFVSNYPNLAQKLLKHSQQQGHLLPPEQEFKALGNLILAEKQKFFQGLHSDNLLTIAKMFHSFLNTNFDFNEFSTELTKKNSIHFFWLIEKIKDLHLDICCSLLTRAETCKLFYLEENEMRLAWLNLAEIILLNKDLEDRAVKAFTIWKEAIAFKGSLSQEHEERYFKFLISLAENLLSHPINENLIPPVDFLLQSPHFPLKQAKHLILAYLKWIIDQGHFNEAHTQLQNQYKNFLSKNQTIEVWIYLCKSYNKNYCFIDGMSIWERLISKSDSHHINALKELTEIILDSLMEKVFNITILSFIQKILIKGSHISFDKKVSYLKICLTKAEEFNFKQTKLLMIFFLENLLDCMETRETCTDVKTINCVSNFLNFVWTSNTPLPLQLKDKLRRSLSNIIIQLHAGNYWLEICNLIEQFTLLKIELDLPYEAARGCLESLSSLVTNEKKGLNLFIETIKQFIPIFSEQEIKPFIENIFIESKKQLPLNMGMFFVNERQLLLKARTLAEWDKEVIKTIRQLLSFNNNERALNMSLQLINNYEISESFIWISCFEKASNKNNNGMLEKACKEFCLLTSKTFLKGSANEKAQCWNSAFSALSNINSKAIVPYLDLALDETSSFATIFSFPENSHLKNQAFREILLAALNSLNSMNRFFSVKRSKELEAAIVQLALNIARLRESLGGYNILEETFIPKLLQCDHQIISNLVVINDLKIFKSICQLLSLLIKNGIKESLFSWTQELSSLVYRVFSQGSAYEGNEEDKEWKAILTLLASQVSLIREFFHEVISIDLIHLCGELLKYTSSNMIHELFLTLLSLLNNSVVSLKNLLNSTLTILIKKNFLEKARLLLVHSETAKHLIPSLYSSHWGDYLLAMVQGHCLDGKVANFSSAFNFMLNNYDFVIGNHTKEEECLEELVSLQINQINEGIIPFSSQSFLILIYKLTHAFHHTNFTENTRGLFQDCLNEETFAIPFIEHSFSNFFSYKIVEIEGYSVTIIDCCPSNEANKTLTEFRKRYFKYMSLLLSRLMKKIYFEDFQKANALHLFVYQNLVLLFLKFLKYPNEALKLIETWIYWIPRDSNIYSIHSEASRHLILNAFSLDIYNEEMLIEQLIYLKEEKSIPSHMRSLKYQPAAFKAIERCLRSEATSKGLALELLCNLIEVFKGGLDLRKTDTMLKEIILKSKSTYFYQIGKLTHSQIIDELIFSYKLSPMLIFSLIDVGYEIYKDPTTVYPQHIPTFRSSGNLLIWLIQRLYLAEISNLYVNEIVTSYYNCLEKILNIPNFISVMVNAQKEETSALTSLTNSIFTIIIYPSPISKCLKQKRNQLFTILIQNLMGYQIELSGKLAQIYLKACLKNEMCPLLKKQALVLQRKYFKTL
jgi:hypothetical protein